MRFPRVTLALRTLQILACSSLFGLAVQPACAQPQHYELGVHYQELSVPFPDIDPDRIEVAELFWYGCPACYDLLPTMQMWETSYRTTDMTFSRMPVIWNETMETHAHLYLAAQEAGLLPVAPKSSWEVVPTIHNSAFDALHKDNNPLLTSMQIAPLFEKLGVSDQAFELAWNSQNVIAKLNELKALPGLSEVPSLPALVVDGRYVITLNDAVTSSEDMYKVLSMLVVQIRGTKRVESH